MLVRTIQESDDASFARLLDGLDRESTFMLFEPGERSSDAAAQRAKIKATLAAERETILVADAAGEFAGFAGVRALGFRRNRHVASLVVGVAARWQRRGIGRELVEEAARWCGSREVHRLEITVVSTNLSAIRLYLATGFVFEGVRRHSLRVNGAFVDEYGMSRLIEPDGTSGLRPTPSTAGASRP